MRKGLFAFIIGSLLTFGYWETQAASRDSGQSTRKPSGTAVGKTLGNCLR